MNIDYVVRKDEPPLILGDVDCYEKWNRSNRLCVILFIKPTSIMVALPLQCPQRTFAKEKISKLCVENDLEFVLQPFQLRHKHALSLQTFRALVYHHNKYS